MHVNQMNIKNIDYNYYFDNFISWKKKKKKIESKNILFDEKN